MLGNIWLSSAFIVTAIFSAGVMYKTYSDVQETKQIKEHYEILSDIKTLLAKQYNKNPQDITRDEIIVHLPAGGNWEKVLLLDRNTNSKFSNEDKELINKNGKLNKDGKLEISENETLKLLALRSKLKNVIDVNKIKPEDGKYIYEVGMTNKNITINDMEIEKYIEKIINSLAIKIIYTEPESPSSDYLNMVNNTIKESIPDFKDKEKDKENEDNRSDILYQEFRTESEISSDTIIDDENDELKERKLVYIRTRIIEKLKKNDNEIETRLYEKLKDIS